MNTDRKIKAFNKANDPFKIMDIDGKYFFGLMSSLLKDGHENYGKHAFVQYAIANDQPLHSYGSGRDWEQVFKWFFRDEKRLAELNFESENGDFVCSSGNLTLLEELGEEFRKLCEDKNVFQTVVNEAMIEAEKETAEEMLRKRSGCNFVVATPEGVIEITEEDRDQLLNGTKKSVKVVNGEAEFEIDAQQFLNLRLGGINYYSEPSEFVRQIAGYPDEEELVNTMSM